MIAKQICKLSREVATLTMLNVNSFKMPITSYPVKTIQWATKTHSDFTKGRSGHNYGSPDALALLTVLEEAAEYAQDGETKNLVNDFLAVNPKWEKSALDNVVCGWRKAYDSRTVRIVVSLPRAPEVEDFLCSYLVYSGAERMDGLAPRGYLERQISLRVK